jgi:hypothetical protein
MNRCLLLPCALQAEQPARSPSKCPTSAPEAKNASRENDCAVLVVVGVMAAFGQVRTLWLAVPNSSYATRSSLFSEYEIGILFSEFPERISKNEAIPIHIVGKTLACFRYCCE